MTMRRTFVLRDSPHVQALWAFLHANWQAASEAGKPLTAEVAEYKAKRSGAANRLYWARLNQIAQDAWVDNKQFSPDAWHAYFAMKFIGCEDMPDGRQVPISTTTLTVPEFQAFLTRVEIYAATELGVELYA